MKSNKELIKLIEKVEDGEKDSEIGVLIRRIVLKDYISWSFPSDKYSEKNIDIENPDKKYDYRVKVDTQKGQKSINIVEVYKLESEDISLLFKVHPIATDNKDKIELAFS